MTSERDPTLESLFAAARQDLPEDDFDERVMAQIDRLRRRAVMGWMVVAVTAAAFVFMLSGPLMHAADLATRILPESLIEVDDHALAQIFSPINSVAGVVGLGILGLWMFYRKIFARK